MSIKGSTWHKWDLHLHTPNTKLSDNYKIDDKDPWEHYCGLIEESDVKVFGITDYFCCDNYFFLIEKFYNTYPDSEKVFFPNIELRLDVSVNKNAEEVNIHILFCNTVSKEKIENFLRKLETNITDDGVTLSCKDLKKSHVAGATVNLKDIKKTLKSVFGNKKPYLIIAAANNAGLRADTKSPRKLIISDEIDKVCDGFFGGSQNVKYFLKNDRYENLEVSVSKPVISGCDAHSFEDINKALGKKVVTQINGSTQVSTNICWIKSDFSFEGLKQVKFEPQYRVQIDDLEPRKPIRRIESIKFNFPSNTYIKQKGAELTQDFCLKKIKDEIHFSPYFTCLIGGRGTGKSTIINILGEKLGEKTDFFNQSNNVIEIDNIDYNIYTDPNNIIEIKGTDEIEFVSQGKIEKLAEGEELTKLIYKERIRESEAGFFDLQKEFDEIEFALDDNIRTYFDIKSTIKTKEELEKERDSAQNIIDSINDERYKKVSNSIEEIQNAIFNLVDSRDKYVNLIDRIKNLIDETKIPDSENSYIERITTVINHLKELDEFKSDEDAEINYIHSLDIKKKLVKLDEDLKTERENLASFFQEKGTSEESIKDSQKASETVARLKHEINILEGILGIYRTKINRNDEKKSKLKELYNINSVLVEENLKLINSKLNINNENLQEIKFDYTFDKEMCYNELFKEFYQIFNNYHISGTSTQSVKEVLFNIIPDEKFLKLEYAIFLEQLNAILEEGRYRRSNNYVQIILNIFASEINFLIYQDLIRKHIYNISRYIKIRGYYGKRELSSCSFGQRCTAVIVTLLMTGVKPLVIDEPEAHLDNKLIADYLVELIKLKKQDRQIIFATHNSNFVINGDAELIHILEIPDNSLHTNITSTTIENIHYRSKLLKLEGGRDAFLIRENKYGFSPS